MSDEPNTFYKDKQGNLIPLTFFKSKNLFWQLGLFLITFMLSSWGVGVVGLIILIKYSCN